VNPAQTDASGFARVPSPFGWPDSKYDVLLGPLPDKHAEQLVVMEEEVAEFRDLYPKRPMNANHFMRWQKDGQTIQSTAVIERIGCPGECVAIPCRSMY
jgi:hypothetical protein